jgi:protein-tyrosine phosphatase
MYIMDEIFRLKAQAFYDIINKQTMITYDDENFDVKKHFISEIKLPNNESKSYGKLYLGSLPSVEIHKQYNIEYIVSIYDLEESLIQKDIEHDVYRIKDNYDNETLNQMNDMLKIILDKIHNYISNNKNVLVHCFAGISRSSTVVLSYLLDHYFYNDVTINPKYGTCNCVARIIKYVKTFRPIISPNQSFLFLLFSNHHKKCKHIPKQDKLIE